MGGQACIVRLYILCGERDTECSTSLIFNLRDLYDFGFTDNIAFLTHPPDFKETDITLEGNLVIDMKKNEYCSVNGSS